MWTARKLMEHLYALFTRRCRTPTAPGKLQKLRHWGKRSTWIGGTFQKGSLTFLDDKLLPATSNAVERDKRRHRKRQKSVNRMHSQFCLEGRIALDMMRESRAEGRDQATQTVHRARRGYT